MGIAFRPDELELVLQDADAEEYPQVGEYGSDICDACEGPGEPRPGFDMNPAYVAVLCDACYEEQAKLREPWGRFGAVDLLQFGISWLWIRSRCTGLAAAR
jgi:hypothetical protein